MHVIFTIEKDVFYLFVRNYLQTKTKLRILDGYALLKKRFCWRSFMRTFICFKHLFLLNKFSRSFIHSFIHQNIFLEYNFEHNVRSTLNFHTQVLRLTVKIFRLVKRSQINERNQWVKTIVTTNNDLASKTQWWVVIISLLTRDHEFLHYLICSKAVISTHQSRWRFLL